MALARNESHKSRSTEGKGLAYALLRYNVFMPNTRSATLSVRLKPEVKKRLAKLARTSGRSSNILISDAVESFVADQELLLAEIRDADADVDAGHYITHDAMKAWLLSWGTEKETPPPSCVCGQRHDERGVASRGSA